MEPLGFPHVCLKNPPISIHKIQVTNCNIGLTYMQATISIMMRIYWIPMETPACTPTIKGIVVNYPRWYTPP